METESSDLIAEQHSWARLPTDVLSIIFTKLGAVHVLLSAQQVCHSWHQVALDPTALFWRCIDMRDLGDDIFRRINRNNFAKLAFDRSGGNVEKFFAKAVSEDFLTYITDRTARLRCFGLIVCINKHPQVLLDFFSRCPLLEELHIYLCVFFYQQYRSIAIGCPGLKCLYIDKIYRNRNIHADSDDEYNIFNCKCLVSYPKPGSCKSSPNVGRIAQMTTNNISSIGKSMPSVSSITSSKPNLELYHEEEADLIIENELDPNNLLDTDDLMALEIANNMLQLRELHLIRCRWLTNKGIHAILDKCLHLEYLNISCCFEVQVDAALQAKLNKIKSVKLSRRSQFHLKKN